MKLIKSFFFITVIIIGVLSSTELHAQGNSLGVKQIKVGNSLREVQQFQKSLSYLTTGLAAVKKAHDQYWEAVANEYLGLLYKDMGEEDNALNYFNRALELYKSQHMSISAKAISDLLGDSSPAGSEDGWNYYAGIEIGSKGIKYSIIKEKRIKGAFSYKSVKSGTNDIDVFSLTDNAINESGTAVKGFWDLIHNYSVKIPDNKIFIAVSSGVQQEINKKKDKKQQLLSAIARSVPEIKVDSVKFLSVGDEIQLETEGTVPPKNMYNSTMMDIGSGNTKGGYFSSVRGKSNSFLTKYDYISFPWASATLGKVIADKPDKLAFCQKFYTDSIENNPANPLNIEMQRRQGFANRQTTYFGGGVVWVMCTYLYPEKAKESFVAFTEKDVDRFIQLAANDYNRLIHPDLTRITDDEVAQEADSQIKSIRFNQAQIIAGAVILRGLTKNLNSQDPKKHFFFAREAVTGWISGYIAQKVAAEYDIKEGQ